jgi:hypothetical protein
VAKRQSFAFGTPPFDEGIFVDRAVIAAFKAL